MEPLPLVLLLLAVYPYLLFPLLVKGCAALFGKGWNRAGGTPPLSMIVSVYNEEKVIAEKLANSLALLYPPGLLEIAVVSDGSSDRTNDIVESVADSRVTLYAFAERKGKTACLNQVIPQLKGEIILFSDANSMFPVDLLQKVAANFSDAGVGLVTGWTRYRSAGNEEATAGIYARLERGTKHAESLVSSCVGADGAVFALRKALYLPLKEIDINDFVIPLNVVAQGKRVVLDPEVFCLEQAASDEKKEFRRQVRITNRTLGAIGRNLSLLNPLRYGSFAFFLLSHKVMRFLAPFWCLALFASTFLLAPGSAFYALCTAAQAFLFGIGIAGLLRFKGGKLTQLCSFLVLTFAAQVIGWGRWASGKNDVLWKPER